MIPKPRAVENVRSESCSASVPPVAKTNSPSVRVVTEVDEYNRRDRKLSNTVERGLIRIPLGLIHEPERVGPS